MIHTKTPEGTYDENDYWTVSWTAYDENTREHKEVVKEYIDCDNAYEDYCYYRKQWWARNCRYERHRR